MAKRILTVLLILTGAISILCAEKLFLAKDGKSDYQIVIPAEFNDNNVEHFVGVAAKFFQDCVMKSTGAKLPIVSEDKMNKNRPGIFIGNTEEAKRNGIALDEFKEWEYVIRSSRKNVILAGKDFKVLPAAKYYWQYSLGTVNAVMVFLKSYCGTRFLVPGPNGIVVKEDSSLSIPENIDLRETPRNKYCIGRPQEIFYDIANNFFPAVNYGTYGGHSHDVAIPVDKYFKTHPEYFVLIKGKRNIHAQHPQYCISNPEVRELIYQELLRKLDQGYEYAQLGQSDGFIKCECDKCAKLYGVKDFGEKLWIMHRDMAQRLIKDRPGKKVMILAYGPTKNPPETFSEFPENVIIELCKSSPEDIAKWKGYKVPGGFTVYFYNWGYHQKEGFTPKVTPEFCKKQLELFYENNIWGIYRCGFGELFGLEGPIYYSYGKLLADPSLDYEELINEYCESAFGSAAEPMNKFYKLLYKRLELKKGDEQTIDWNNRNLLDGKMPQLNDNIKILTIRYPPEVLAELETCLNEAEKKVNSRGEKIRFELVLKEFKYLKKTARVAELFVKYRKNPSLKRELLDAIKAREKYVESIPVAQNGRILAFEGIPLFGQVEKSILLIGGEMYGASEIFVGNF
ncbi:MAG: hypothetical protein BWY31_01154 [Lentisphaerae bacterium ADurb.Bin242]|nr:MAG: hypothetical protein BWY31_01154 [Lentisphaerae bacterium ADurb.Bin242]